MMFLSHTSAPELVALLSDAIEHLERKVIPLQSMILSVLLLPYNVHYSIKDDLDGVPGYGLLI